jgi:hypothetical protein
MLLQAGAASAQGAAATTTALTIASAGKAVTTVGSGAVVKLTATVMSGSTPIQLGQVHFCDATAKHCTDIHIVGVAQLTDAGTASFKFRPGPGTHSYKAVFAGVNAFKASVSAAEKLTVTPLARSATATKIVPGGGPGGYSLTATVNGNASNAPAGTVSFLDISDGSAVVGSEALVAGTAGLNFVDVPNVSNISGSCCVTVGDFNGDGILDIFADNTVLLGNGDGTFTSLPRIQGSVDPASVALGDFRGEGRLDIAALATSVYSVEILLSKGNGTFDVTQIPNIYPRAGALATADFNGDGILDLAVMRSDPAYSYYQQAAVLLGTGNGNFNLVNTYVSPEVSCPYPSGMVAADLNGDGKTDLAIACGNYTQSPGGTVVVMLGNGDGTFAGKPAIPTTGFNPSAIVSADFNGDGIPDLAVTSPGGQSNGYAGTVTVLLGKGDGTFKDGVNIPTGAGSSGVAVGDFNGDDIPDLAVANAGAFSAISGQESGVLTVLLGKGDGTFEAAAANPPVSYSPSSIAAGDFNGDGVQDLVLPLVNATVQVLLAQTQSATATASGIAFPVATGTHELVANYAGNSEYKGSESGAVSLAPATPGVRLTASPNQDPAGSKVTFTAAVLTDGVAATGSVAFTFGGAPLGSASLNAKGVAEVSYTPTGLGWHGVRAAYSGDKNYTAAESPPFLFKVTGDAKPAVTLMASPTATGLGGDVVFTATVMGGQRPPTGTVQFLDSGMQIGAGALDGNTSVMYTTGKLAVGAHRITAQYEGDDNYEAVTSAPVTVTVNE